MIREKEFQQIYDKEKNKESKLALACKRFLDAQERYQNGEGDVISGLINLDDLAEEIKELNKLN